MKTCTDKNTLHTHIPPQTSNGQHPHTGVDGETCEECSIGKYKAVSGSVACSTCPLNSNSSAVSTNRSDCKCDPGYTGEDQHPRQTQSTQSKPLMHNTQTNTHINTFSNIKTHDTLIFMRKHQTDKDTRSQTHLHTRTHTTQTSTHRCRWRALLKLQHWEVQVRHRQCCVYHMSLQLQLLGWEYNLYM
jgi:hypothetical protein